MTEKTRKNLEIASLGIFSLIFGAGAGWGTTQARMATFAEQLNRIDQRVADIYCAQVPAAQRPGCR